MSSLLKDSNNNSRRVFALLSPKKTWKITKWAIILSILCLINTSHWSTCPSSNSTLYTITSDQCSFSGYSITEAFNVVLGPVSASLYFLYSIYTPGNKWAIRKTNSDGSLAWMSAVSFQPILKSLSVDTLEQNVYVAGYANPLDVVRFGAGAGSIVDAQR